MKILVVNVGSTSLKYKALQMPEESELCSGKIDRIGAAGGSVLTYKGPCGHGSRSLGALDYGGALSAMLTSVSHPDEGGFDLADINGVGFKTVHARGINSAVLLDDDALARMEDYLCVAPAHNPPYLVAVRAIRNLLPGTPLVGVFEAHFHTTMPLSTYSYALPPSLRVLGVRKYGFHGASHHYISERVRQVQSDSRRVVSCHLGGSSSVCAILDGRSIDTSMGFSPQTGLPQATRSGDIDPYVIVYLMKEGYSLEQVEDLLGKQSGLLGVSQVSAEMSDILVAAEEGHEGAVLAVEMYCVSLRRYLGAYAALLGGLDAVVFTGGIGENSPLIRQKAVAGLEFMGVHLDPQANLAARGETLIGDGRCKVWVLPTNEELIVARESAKLLCQLEKS